VKHLAKVFVVDDDAILLSSIEALLTAQGYTVKCFTSAEEFLTQHHPTQVGCVLIDLWMPGMGGSELLQRLRESRSLLSVIIISGLFDSTAIEEIERAFVPLLAKPYEVETFLQMIEDGIAGSVKRRAEQLKGWQGGGQTPLAEDDADF
jgi:FixJ family two-component response regulator